MNVRPLALSLAVLAAVAPSACSGAAPRASVPRTSVVPSTTSTTKLAEPLPPSRGWSPSAGEDTPGAKEAASRALLALATYPLGGGTPAASASRLEAAGLPPALAQQGAGLLDSSAEGTAAIVYPQLGGIGPDAASVMVVAELRTRAPGRPVRTVRRVVELHVRRGGAAWAVEAISTIGGDPVDAAATDPAVAALLANRNVELSDSNRWDLLAGRVDPRVVALLGRLAGAHKLAVTVLATGHPANVFGTDRASNHAAGRAVDIWAVDGVAVADQRQPGSPLEALVRQLVAEGVTELGSPFDLDGRGGAMFSDLVHHDHLHVAFRR